MENKLPKGWKVVELQAVTTVIGGGTPKTNISEYWDGDIIWMSPVDLPPIGEITDVFSSRNKITQLGIENSSAKLLPQETVIFSSRASIGKIGIAKVALATNQGFTNFICSEKIYNRFLAYSLKRFTPEITQLSNSTTFAEVSKSSLKSFKIPLPPLPEQQRIVAKLDKLFARIDKAIAMVEENIKNTEHLMDSAWNTLIPQLEGQTTTLGEVCTLNPPKSEVREITNKLVTFLPMADLNEKELYVRPQQSRNIDEVKNGYTYFKDGDVLLAKVTPCFENGKGGIAQNLENGIGFGSSEYYVLRPNKAVLAEYIYFITASSNFMTLGAQNMSGAVGLKRVIKDFVKDYPIVIPSLNVQRKICKYLINLKDKQTATLELQKQRLKQLKHLKSSLLDSAFKGEL